MKWGGESDYESERVIELYKLNRGYKELIEMLNSKRVNKIKNLPCDENNTAVGNDDNVDNYSECVPGYRTGVLIAADDDDEEMIKYLIGTYNNNKGDRTKITNVDRFNNMIIGNNYMNHCYDIMNRTSLNSYYIDSVSRLSPVLCLFTFIYFV